MDEHDTETEALTESLALFDVSHGALSGDVLHAMLTEKIEALINHDFGKLIRILYRIDVDEQKLKTLLAEKSGKTDAEVIADAVIARQLLKIETRRHYGRHEKNADEF